MSGTQKLGFCRTSRLEESSALTVFVDEMIHIMDEFVETIKLHQSNGEYQFDFASLSLGPTRKALDETLFISMLRERPEIARCQRNMEGYEVALAPAFVTSEEDKNLRIIEPEEFDIMYANHILWLHGLGGKQADFSGCLFDDITLGGLCLEHAIFDGAEFRECDFFQTRFTNASFEGACFRGGFIHSATAMGCNFRKAQFHKADFELSNLAESNLTAALLYNCNLTDTYFPECCLELTNFTKSHPEYGNTEGCAYDEAAWLKEHPNTGPKTIPNEKED